MSLREEAKGYQSIAGDLREQIRAGGYVPGAFLPTERELQDLYGVSRSTVRRALSLLADSGWAEIKPNRGVAVKIGTTNEKGAGIAFIDHADTVNQSLFFALSRELQRHGMHLTHIDSRPGGMESAVEYAADHGFAAAFVWSKSGFPDAERLAKAQQRMPVLAVDHSLRDVPCDLTVANNLQGASLVVQHLIRQGRRNIAITGMMDMLEVTHESFSGYLHGLFSCDLEATPRNFAMCQTSGMDAPDTTVLSRRLQDTDRPNAVYVMQAMCVPAVVEAIYDLGLSVPEDIAVVACHDDFPYLIEGVGLTTAVVDWQAFAATAVKQLLRRFVQPAAPFIKTMLPMSLVVRGSCGAPRAEWAADEFADQRSGSPLSSLRRQYQFVRPLAAQGGRREKSTHL